MMRTPKFPGSASFSIALLAGVMLSACGRGSNPVIPVTPDAFRLKSHVVTVTVVDAATGKVLKGTNLSIAANGPSDLSGYTNAKYTTSLVTNGAIAVYTDSTATVTASATAANYLPSAVSVYTGKAKNVGVVKLINLAAPPAGVTVSKIKSVSRVDFAVPAGLPFVSGTGRIAGTDSILSISSVAALTGSVDTFSLAATGANASVYFLAPGSSAWTLKGNYAVVNAAVKLGATAAGTYAVGTKIPATTVTLTFSESVGFDAEITLSADGWTRTIRNGGDTVQIQGVPTGVSVSITASVFGTQTYFITRAFVASETFDLAYKVNDAIRQKSATQSFQVKCTDGTVPTELKPGFPAVVLDNNKEVGLAVVTSQATTIRVPAVSDFYVIPATDKAYGFLPSANTITLEIDCKIITGATGGSSN